MLGGCINLTETGLVVLVNVELKMLQSRITFALWPSRGVSAQPSVIPLEIKRNQCATEAGNKIR